MEEPNVDDYVDAEAAAYYRGLRESADAKSYGKHPETEILVGGVDRGRGNRLKTTPAHPE